MATAKKSTAPAQIAAQPATEQHENITIAQKFLLLVMFMLGSKKPTSEETNILSALGLTVDKVLPLLGQVLYNQGLIDEKGNVTAKGAKHCFLGLSFGINFRRVAEETSFNGLPRLIQACLDELAYFRLVEQNKVDNKTNILLNDGSSIPLVEYRKQMNDWFRNQNGPRPFADYIKPTYITRFKQDGTDSEFYDYMDDLVYQFGNLLESNYETTDSEAETAA